jgi:hypothetical protein
VKSPGFRQPGAGRKVKSGPMLTIGSEGVYEWLVTDRQFDLLRICPDVGLEKYIVITSFDSSPLVPTAEAQA